MYFSTHYSKVQNFKFSSYIPCIVTLEKGLNDSFSHTSHCIQTLTLLNLYIVKLLVHLSSGRAGCTVCHHRHHRPIWTSSSPEDRPPPYLCPSNHHNNIQHQCADSPHPDISEILRSWPSCRHLQILSSLFCYPVPLSPNLDTSLGTVVSEGS